MGKKRTHAETKDGFTKPPPDKDRMSAAKQKEKRKNGEDRRPKAALVC